MNKPVLLTGMRPTSHLHIGNLFGALKPLVEYQGKYQTFLMVADIHALTTMEETKKIKENTLDIIMLYLASGVDSKKVTLFVQSAIPEQVALSTLFGMIVPKSMLELNPVYKEMIADHPKATNLGLLAYPVLQAADILAYKAGLVPVGKDQLPHLELTREIARRFNTRFGKTFPEPESKLQKDIKILSLQDPKKKMSKSHGAPTQIGVHDTPEQIRKKIKTAVTDSGSEVLYYPEKKPAVANLMMIMHLAGGKSLKDIEKEFQGKGYGDFKNAVAESLIEYLVPIQENYKKLSKDKKYIEKLLEDGNKKARKIAEATYIEAKNKIGLL
ncbi:MAG: tryptophan--tRNA ligase [bacterium]|nr:tryptophan--tRNA ligase [bacterium]